MGATFYKTNSNEDEFKANTSFKSFHHQAHTLVSDRALIAGFLMLWLKHYIISSLCHDAITIEVVYLAVLLVHGKPLGLLLVMLCKIQSGLREQSIEFFPGARRRRKVRVLVLKLRHQPPTSGWSCPTLMSWHAL